MPSIDGTTIEAKSGPPPDDRPLASGDVSAAERSSTLDLKYRKASIWLLAMYLPFLIVPWCLTCVMMFRPISFPAYLNQNSPVTVEDARSMESWLTAVNILSKIGATMAIPVVSAILAHAAVVYSQRRKPSDTLNAYQLVALADRGWLDFPTLRRSFTAGPVSASWFLWQGALIMLLVVAQPSLQSLFVKTCSAVVLTCEDDVTSRHAHCIYQYSTRYMAVGFDPEPGELEHCPQDVVTGNVLKKSLIVGHDDLQPHLWPEREQADTRFLSRYYENRLNSFMDGSLETFFVSAIPYGTLTGALRSHAMRLNSSVTCTHTDKYPDPCPGDRPFVKTFSRGSDLKARVCVPGDYSKVPWTTSRDRQDIKEEMWITRNSTPSATSYIDYTLYCEVSSTRGYFELGNEHNSFTPGPLLDKWPSVEELEREFSDYASSDAQRAGRADKDLYPMRMSPSYEVADTRTWRASNWFGTRELPTPGPLMTAALSIFGNGSFFHAATQAVEEDYDEVARALCAKRLLGTAVFLANEALLTSTASEGWRSAAREVYSSPGTTVMKPKKTTTGIVVVSVLIGLQVACLVALVYYTCSVPTWTAKLDAFAMAQVGAQLGFPATAATGIGPNQDGLVVDRRAGYTTTRTETIPHTGPRANGRTLSEGVMSIHRGQSNDTSSQRQIGNCSFPEWDELYITDFLQEQLDGLTNSDHCWIIKGVRGLHELLHRNITANPMNNVTIPECVPLNISSSGNTFSIYFSNNKFDVNGVDEDTFVILTYIHLVTMTAAFFLAYPIILVLASTPSLCIMIDRPLEEPTRQKIEKWQTIFQTAVFAPLAIAGLVTGIVGMGNSDHARTEHGIIGYVTVGLAALVVPLYLYQKRLNSRPDLSFLMYRRLKLLNAFDFTICQAILLISGFALPDGIDDFGTMTLCGTNTISSSLIFSFGMIVSFVWNCAMATMTVQWLLGQRIRGGTFRDRAPPWMLKVLRKRSGSL
ncbi:hypothetical protein C8035_v005705 [Colletotrichum spinosum]|uniref:Uncharacterized protein n=1 Tax=Colletotrichum spinosum TaxID=1347390 RepID=A0A4R8QJJ3_9PEZI|nr:hypothetical protein C8035_v005705 [Colletotrichum spinosum]